MKKLSDPLQGEEKLTDPRDRFFSLCRERKLRNQTLQNQVTNYNNPTVCMNVRTNNEDYVRRLRSKILQPEFEDSSTRRRIFDRTKNLRSDEDSSTAIFDPLFLDSSYRLTKLELTTVKSTESNFTESRNQLQRP